MWCDSIAAVSCPRGLRPRLAKHPSKKLEPTHLHSLQSQTQIPSSLSVVPGKWSTEKDQLGKKGRGRMNISTRAGSSQAQAGPPGIEHSQFVLQCGELTHIFAADTSALCKRCARTTERVCLRAPPAASPFPQPTIYRQNVPLIVSTRPYPAPAPRLPAPQVGRRHLQGVDALPRERQRPQHWPGASGREERPCRVHDAGPDQETGGGPAQDAAGAGEGAGALVLCCEGGWWTGWEGRREGEGREAAGAAF